MDIKHNAGQRRFEIEVDGYKAHVAYSIHDNGWIFVIPLFRQR